MDMKAILRPGDELAYWQGGLYGWMIATKTWHKVGHVEKYIGDGRTIGSRAREGVGTFALESKNLIAIRRPLWDFDLASVLRWQKTVDGMRYDWDGLLAFVGIRTRDDDQMFCSEHNAWADKVSGGNPFCGESPRRIAPFQFLITPAYETIWSSYEE